MESDATPPTRESVLAWMKENGAGYKRAAKHFSLNVETVKTWQKWSKRPPPPPKAEKEKAVKVKAPKAPRPPKPPRERKAAVEAIEPSEVSAEPLRPGEAMELIDVSLGLRLRWLAHPASVGRRGERDTAITTGILIDKRAKLSQPSEGGGEEKAAGLDAALKAALARAGGSST